MAVINSTLIKNSKWNPTEKMLRRLNDNEAYGIVGKLIDKKNNVLDLTPKEKKMYSR